MPRAERPLERDGSPLTEFAADLRKLREKAGSPPYRELARRAHYSSTTLSDAASGRQLPSLAVTLAYVAACDGDRREWETSWQSLAADLNEKADIVDELSTGAPYVGLFAYGPDDAELFFGRERLVEDVTTRLRGQRFLAVFGPSGAGKSSALRAGLIPVLRKTSAETVVLFTPGHHPLHECAIQLASLLATTTLTVERDLATGPTALHSLVEQLLSTQSANAEVVFVVDQFEEVFTLCTDPGELNAFVSLLLTASSTDSRCRVVLGVRADFYAHCAQHPGLAEALQDAQVTVGPMTADELRRAITWPARVAGCAVESDLLSVLIAHAHGQAGSLPLLSHALLQTWRRRKGNTLTLAGFQATGGFEGALARTAETVLGAMTAQQQNLTQHLFRRLTALGDGTDDSKRRIRRSELDDTPDTNSVLHTLSEARLVSLDRDTVEITHEALISAWPRLQRWLNADREGHRLHRELTDSATVWQTHDHDPAALLRGNRLILVADWAAADTGLSELEQEFLQASVNTREREHASTRRQIRRQRILIAVLTVMVVVATAALVYASNAQQNATRQRNTALALRAAPAAVELVYQDPQRAATIALAAYRLHPSAETEGALITTAAVVESIQLPSWVAITSDDARVLISTDPESDMATIFSITDDGLREESSVPFVGRNETGRFPSISPDSQTLLSPGSNDEYVVWDISDIRHPIMKSTVPAQYRVRDWSSDGQNILTDAHFAAEAPELDTSQLWNIGDLRVPVLVATIPGWGAEFVGGVNRVATMKRSSPDILDGFITLYKASTDGHDYKPDVTIKPPRMSIQDIKFSADGRQATLVEDEEQSQPDGTVFISRWSIKSGLPAEIIQRREYRGAVTFSLETGYDGAYPPTLMAVREGNVVLRDLASGRQIISISTGNATDTGYVHFAPSLKSLFVVKESKGKSQFSRLELNVAKAVSRSCQHNMDTVDADMWSEYFPGVTPFHLCP